MGVKKNALNWCLCAFTVFVGLIMVYSGICIWSGKLASPGEDPFITGLVGVLVGIFVVFLGFLSGSFFYRYRSISID